jgi:ABC-type sugar transport system substrate-binding protein
MGYPRSLQQMAGMILAISLVGCGVATVTPEPPAATSTPVPSTATPTAEPSTPTPVPPTPTRVPPTPIPMSHLVVGFSQMNSNSQWLNAMAESMRETAEELGVKLTISNGESSREKQISDLREYIKNEVDVIGIDPVTWTGWKEVFKEAEEAGIPIIIVTHHFDIPEDRYATRLGPDFREEGRKAGREMVRLLNGKGNVVEIGGLAWTDAAFGRARGFREVIQGTGIEITQSYPGDFAREKGMEVMQSFLTKDVNIQGVYSHNDDMALGAIQAIEQAGLRPGVDIKIVSVDAVRGAFEAMIAGKLNATVECNPFIGPQFFEVALKLANGEEVSERILIKEGIFLPEDAQDMLPTRKY